MRESAADDDGLRWGIDPALNVKARRGDKAFPSNQETLEGRVVGAEVEDLNSDGLPDLSGGTRLVTYKPVRSTQF